MTVNRKYPAYPLVTCDPYFSVWSMYDKLNEDFTRHWTGRRHPLTGIITVDGVSKTFMGRMRVNSDASICGPKNIEQKKIVVTPLKSIYTFSDDKIELEVCFVTPLVLNDLQLMGRPISYISYTVKSLDNKTHNCSVYIDASALLTVNSPNEKVTFGKTELSVYVSSGEERILAEYGDNLCINWGSLHMAARGGNTGTASDEEKMNAHQKRNWPSDNQLYKTIEAKGAGWASYPCIYYKNDYSVNENGISDFICIGYDDIHSIKYFGNNINAYYKKDGKTFMEMLKDSLDNYESIMEIVNSFDNRIISDAHAISEDYADLISIAYRQVVAAHKLAYDGNKPIFVSKECFSNGCAGTVDVTYPSIPLFLAYNADLVEYMLNPIFDYASSKEWIFEYAPHDVGIYPWVNGQVYGKESGKLLHERQMPVEESGNMLLCVAALCKAKGSANYAEEHFDILEQWANYLTEYGFDPENQLCTDDFAGHLAHNCNLSVKAILGIAAWGMLLNMMNKENGEKYLDIARNFAGQWKALAYDGNHYRLAFDRENTWSIKYNLVWDKLLDLNIFDRDIFEDEVKYYKTKVNKYGLPLDGRSVYSKTDWQLWSTALTFDSEYDEIIISSLLRMLADTNDRVPFTDWYYSDTAIQREFQNRSVQGGLFIKLLQYK